MSYPNYSILLYSISYILFFLLLLVGKEKKGLRLFDEKSAVANPGILIILHIGGIVLFGILPLLFYPPHSSMLSNNSGQTNLPVLFTVLLLILALFIAPRIAKNKYKASLNKAPVYTFPDIKFIIAYFLVRILFIGAYENWFRGYLLNDCIISFGPVLAVLLNVGLYTLLHIVNGKDEVFACIPFGLLLCSLCIWLSTAWPAIVIHLALTVTYEISFLRINKARQILLT